MGIIFVRLHVMNRVDFVNVVANEKIFGSKIDTSITLLWKYFEVNGRK